MGLGGLGLKFPSLVRPTLTVAKNRNETGLIFVLTEIKVAEPKPAPLEFRQQLLLALVQCTGKALSVTR